MSITLNLPNPSPKLEITIPQNLQASNLSLADSPIKGQLRILDFPKRSINKPSSRHPSHKKNLPSTASLLANSSPFKKAYRKHIESSNYETFEQTQFERKASELADVLQILERLKKPVLQPMSLSPSPKRQFLSPLKGSNSQNVSAMRINLEEDGGDSSNNSSDSIKGARKIHLIPKSFTKPSLSPLRPLEQQTKASRALERKLSSFTLSPKIVRSGGSNNSPPKVDHEVENNHSSEKKQKHSGVNNCAVGYIYRVGLNHKKGRVENFVDYSKKIKRCLPTSNPDSPKLKPNNISFSFHRAPADNVVLKQSSSNKELPKPLTNNQVLASSLETLDGQTSNNNSPVPSPGLTAGSSASLKKFILNENPTTGSLKRLYGKSVRKIFSTVFLLIFLF